MTTSVNTFLVLTSLASALLRTISDAIRGQKSPEELAAAAIDDAIAAGVAPSLLAQHLTARARERAEAEVDILQGLVTLDEP